MSFIYVFIRTVTILAGISGVLFSPVVAISSTSASYRSGSPYSAGISQSAYSQALLYPNESESNTAAGFFQSEQLRAADGAANDLFGTSVAVSGNTMVIGAHFDDVGENENQGSAYVFVRTGSTWSQQQQIVAEDGAADDQFGWSVAIAGDTIVVGAYRDNVSANVDQGTAYVFVRTGTTWLQQAHLSADDGSGGDRFGSAVAIDGDTIVVGAQRDSVALNARQGSVYVYTRNGDTWVQEQQLLAGDGAADDEFGQTVAIDGDTILVGAPIKDIALVQDQGAAYVFVRNGSLWTQQQRLLSAGGAESDYFGWSVGVDMDRAVVGAPGRRVEENTGQGAVYISTRSGTAWSEPEQLVANDGAKDDMFGDSVAILDETVVIGAPKHAENRGSAYVFQLSNTSWTQQPQLNALEGLASDEFGGAVAIDDTTLVIGAAFDDVESKKDQGTAYVFEPGKVRQVIYFPALPDLQIDTPSVPFSVTTSSGLPASLSSQTPAVCTVSGGTLTVLNLGICTIVAEQNGDDTYGPATAQQNYAVVDSTKESQTIAFSELVDQPIGIPPFMISATASSGLPVSFDSETPDICSVSGNTVSLLAPGLCTIVAKQNGDDVYNAATATQSFAVIDPSKQDQTIVFAGWPDSGQMGQSLQVTVTASSGLPVDLSMVTPSICELSGTTLTFLTVGTCAITAFQGGNETYNAATVSRQVIITGIDSTTPSVYLPSISN